MPTALWLVVVALLVPLAVRASEHTYIVKRGDTVYGIARSYGVSQDAVADRNGLSRNYHIYPGQRLIIPSRPSAHKKARDTKLPRSIQRAIDEAPVKSGRWKYIVIHHSGVDTGTMKSMDRYHREVRHMEHGLAYHFVIGNGHGMRDGQIGVGQRWTRQLAGGHLASEAQNKIAIGICLVGNFDKHPPTRKEMDSLRALVEALMARCTLTPRAVKTHRQINVVYTRCPGDKFPTKSFLASLHSPHH